jgi:hypothetical protein
MYAKPRHNTAKKQLTKRIINAVFPRAALYINSWGLSRMELIIKAASQSSFIPFVENEAAIGMVPYIQSGEAIPIRLAGIIPKMPSRLFCKAVNRAWILFFPNTEMIDPNTIPSAQYPAICVNWTLK